MMGRLNHDQGRLFYSFCLEEAVPDDHLVRKVAAVLDLSWVHAELAPHYPDNGRPSIDPELMIRMLIIGYVFAIRSERALCRDVQVNLAYRWFCGLQRSIPGSQWNKECAAKAASRAVREYLATLDDAAFGAASEVTPKFVSPSDRAAHPDYRQVDT